MARQWEPQLDATEVAEMEAQRDMAERGRRYSAFVEATRDKVWVEVKNGDWMLVPRDLTKPGTKRPLVLDRAKLRAYRRDKRQAAH